MPTLAEERIALDKLREDYSKKWDGYSLKTLPDGTEAKDIPANDLEELNKLQDAMAEKGALVDKLQKAEDAAREAKDAHQRDNTPDRGGLTPPVQTFGQQPKSLGELFRESKVFKDRIGSVEFGGDGSKDGFDVKDWLGLGRKFFGGTGTAGSNLGYMPQYLPDENVAAPLRQPNVIDSLPIEPCESNGFSFMLQTLMTSNAASRIEGEAPSQAAIQYALTTGIIAGIRDYIDVAEEEFEDVPALQSLIQNDLMLGVRQKADDYLTNSNSATYGYGMLNVSGIQTQAFTGYSFVDGIRVAINDIEVTGRGRATTGYFHFTKVMNGIDLLKTADGQFVFPGGLMQGDGTRRIWGIQLYSTDASGITETAATGVGLVIDNRWVKIKMRKDITVNMTDSHNTNFTAGVKTITAVMRMGLKCTRAYAIVKCTAIA